ncbi:MAG TPA: tetratricopeptide repeat protein [Candidatus Syntrophosphaera sp.]|jgi:tol-pal system protein YbgF|nr:tetratricopeptide repeat protein [Candidatus Syntrophosphaera sp.]
MKTLFTAVLALFLLLGACASNKAVREQKGKLQSIEARQNNQAGGLEMAQKDIRQNRKKLDELIIRLNGVETQLREITALQDKTGKPAEDISQLRDDLAVLRSDLETTVTENNTLEARISELAADTDETFDAYTDYLQRIKQTSADYATKDEVAKLREESEKVARIMQDLAKKVEEQHSSQPTETSSLAGLSGIKDRIAGLEEQLESAQKEIEAKGENMETDLQALRGRVSDVNSELSALNSDLQSILSQGPSVVAPQRQIEMEALYRTALSEYDKGTYENSIRLFEDFLNQYPDTDLSPNAAYWIAENYYSAEIWTKALREFQYVATRYPDHPKAWDAQLKTGLTYLRLGDKIKAREALTNLKKTHPDYPEMQLLDKYLRMAN